MPDTIGFIGLGVMGAPMARNLLAAGQEARRAQPQPRAGGGARGGRGASGRRVRARSGERADVVILMLPDSPAVEAVALGEDGVLAGALRGRSARST